ncbi:MAG: putative aminopeptidase YsdC [Tenericutes bacterium ADurb.Bin239]|nr:MAG: putative aminopeptidase YsdC [Tenericutes bacterium ADurb.Bin239]
MDPKRLDLLKKISEVNGISGAERDVARLVKAELKGVADTFAYDNLGSIVANLDGEKGAPRVLLAGHMDEVGFLVKQIEKSGFLRLHNVGGWWGHVVPAHEWVVTTREGKEYIGVTGAQPPHGMPAEQRNKVMELKDMYLDMGVSSDEDIKNLGIKVGDTVTPLQKFRVLNDGKTLLGKAWDDRVAVAIGIEVLKRLKKEGHHANVSFVGTVQEEVGLRGARTSTHLVKPDLAFALDVTMSYDLPGSPAMDTKLGAGVALSVMDGSVIAHRGLFDHVERVAKKLGVKYTYDLLTAGGTDSGEIHKAYDGVVNMTLSIPCRYFHSHVSLVHSDDIDAAIDLLVEVIKGVDWDLIKKLKATKYE